MFDVVRSISLGVRQIAGIFLILIAGWTWICVLDQPALAETPGYMAGALACPPRVEGPDCNRETALDVIVQPVALITELPDGRHRSGHASEFATGQHAQDLLRATEEQIMSQQTITLLDPVSGEVKTIVIGR